jgi:ubiquitin-protein ligase
MTSRESPRIRRLRADLRALQQLRTESSVFDFVAYGNPPERYEITFLGPGLRLSEDQTHVEYQMVHRAEIRLGANYPRAMPELAWRTPVFHPNISAVGMVCLGGYGQFWVPSLQLDELCSMLWDMVRFANYDVASPYNRSAADWTRTQSQYTFPLDRRGLRDRLSRAGPGDAVPIVEPSLPAVVLTEAPAAGEDVIFLEEAPPRPAGRPPDQGIVFIE